MMQAVPRQTVWVKLLLVDCDDADERWDMEEDEQLPIRLTTHLLSLHFGIGQHEFGAQIGVGPQSLSFVHASPSLQRTGWGRHELPRIPDENTQSLSPIHSARSQRLSSPAPHVPQAAQRPADDALMADREEPDVAEDDERGEPSLRMLEPLLREELTADRSLLEEDRHSLV